MTTSEGAWTKDDEVRDGLIQKVEEEAHHKDINVSKIVQAYTNHYSDKPLLRLIQHINQRVGIYSNLLEDMKKLQPIPSKNSDEYDAMAVEIKERYEELGLIPRGFIPNTTTAQRVVRYVLEKLAAFGRALLEIMAKYASEIRREVRIDVGVTVHFDVEVSWSPTVTIGIEGPGAKLRSEGA